MPDARHKALLAAVLVAVLLAAGSPRSDAQETVTEELRHRTFWHEPRTDPWEVVQIALSLAGVAVAVHAALGLRRGVVIPSEAVQKLGGSLAGGKLDEAKELCAQPSGFASVVRAGLSRSDLGQDSVLRAITLAAENETIIMRQRAGRVALAAATIVLVGLFRTLMQALQALNRYAAYDAGYPADLAYGLSWALMLSCLGLMLFVPLFLAHRFLHNRAVKLGHEMKMKAEELLCRVGQKK